MIKSVSPRTPRIPHTAEIATSRRTQSLWGLGFFVAAIVLYLVSHIGFELALGLSPQRHIVWATDDNYAYLVKTPLMRDCLSQTCKALTGIEEQTHTLLEEPAVNFMQNSIRHRSLLSYHPLYSVIVGWLADGFHLSYDHSLVAINVLGHILTAFAAGYLLYQLFGPGAAALGLLLFAALWGFPQAYIMKPGTLAVYTAVLGWALVVKPTTPRLILATLALAAAAGFHTVGAVLAIQVAFWLWLVSEQRFKFNHMVFYAVVFVMAVCFVKLQPQFVPADISIANLYHGPSGLLALVKANLKAEMALIEPMSLQYGLPLLIVGPLLAACLGTPFQRRAVLAILAIIVLSFLGSLLYPAPIAPLMERLWPTWQLGLFGATGAGIVACFRFAPSGKQIRQQVWRWCGGSRGGPGSQNMLVLLPLLGAGLAVAYAVVFGAGITLAAYGFMLRNKNIQLNADQLALLGGPDKPASTLLPLRISTDKYAYALPEALLYFNLMQGKQASPVIVAEATLRQAPEKLANARQVYTLNPIPGSSGSDLRLIPGNQPVLSAPQPILALYVRNDAPGQSNSFTANSMQLSVPGGFEGWLALPHPENQLSLAQGAGTPLRIGGVRLSASQTTYWPWEEGVNVQWTYNNQGYQARVHKSSLLPGYPCAVGQILNDYRSTVVASITCAPNAHREVVSGAVK